MLYDMYHCISKYKWKKSDVNMLTTCISMFLPYTYSKHALPVSSDRRARKDNYAISLLSHK